MPGATIDSFKSDVTRTHSIRTFAITRAEIRASFEITKLSKIFILAVT
jgi:hypothetical protein